MSPSGFYASRTRPESKRAHDDRRLSVLVQTSFTAGRGYYGSPRIYDDFVDWGEPVNRKRIIRLMQQQGLVARVRKRYKRTTMSDHDQPIADNLLRQQFTAARPNHRWVGDTTELRIGQSGKAYLAAIVDLYSRFVVGWAISAVNERHLTIKAFDMAVKRRCPDVGLLHHFDQGSTYASEDYQAVLATHGLTCSMSRRGNCYDNAVMEAFFSTVKSEIGEWFESHGDAKAWMLACLRDRGPYPVLVLSGEQGSAKSTFSAIVRAILDPNTAPLRALPREDRDLFIAATNGHLLTFDNVSGPRPLG